MNGIFSKGGYYTIPMGGPDFETSTNINTVGIILQLTIDLWITGKEVIMGISFYIFKRILEMSNRVVYGKKLLEKETLFVYGGSWKWYQRLLQ